MATLRGLRSRADFFMWRLVMTKITTFFELRGVSMFMEIQSMWVYFIREISQPLYISFVIF